jgi:Zn-dependent M28 family amino/carboxypeptidase
LLKTILLATALTAAPFAALAADVGQIDPARISAHVKVLGSDAFEGRGPATPGEEKTVAYIVEQMKAAGLQPGGDVKGGQRAWTQDVPLARFENKGVVTSSVTAGGQTTSFTQGEQIALRPASNGANHVTVKNAPVVFVGYGVKAPERNWDDFKGLDLKGKIALVLVNDPDFETGKGDFGGKAMTYYGRWTYKFEEAARQGAVGFIVIHETDPASYGWATVKNSNTIATFDIVRPDPTKDHALVEGWIQRDVTVDLFKKAGLDFEAAKKAAQSRDFKPVPLTGVTFSADYAVDVSKVVSKNVAGLLPGTKRPGEYVVYSAHWDHLGIGPADAKGDVIYNGAVDNASGVGDLLELGRVFAKEPRTDRSVLFLAVTAEEKGLLGSEYYASAPLFPLAKTVALLNMDALGLGGPAKDFSVRGDSGVSLQDDLIAVAAKHGRAFSPDPRPEAGSFYRSDHFPMAKRGVPAISYNAGQDLKVGGAVAGKAWQDAYTTVKYHQPADEWSADLDFTGQAEDVNILYETGRQLANSTVWPGWKAGSEFKAARDTTEAQRK